jgi:hypothetical protein
MNGGVSPVVIAIAFAIPITIMLLVGGWAIRIRSRYRRGRRGPLSTRVEGISLGSAREIADAGSVPWENLLEALAVAPERHGPGPDGQPHDEGWMGTMLGLRSRMSSATDLLEPHVLWGEREGRQVLIRLGPDEKIAGGTVMYSNRHVRVITVVRAAFPEFELAGEDGTLRLHGDAPADVSGLVTALSRAPDVWQDLIVVAGADGIVATRPIVGDAVNGWLYDLWLMERLARVLDAPPLSGARIGPEWTVPYGLGRSRRPRGRPD